MGGGAMRIDLPTIQLKAASCCPLPIRSSRFSSSSSTSSNHNFPVSVNNNINITEPPSPSGNTATRMDSAGGKEVIRTSRPSFDDAILGPVPSRFEVENAVAALQSFVYEISASGSELNRFEQMLDLSINVGSLLSNGYGRLLDALRLLQTEPSIKRLVVSLSSDKAIWDAIMNNEMVQKLRESNQHSEDATWDAVFVSAVGQYSLPGCEEEPDQIARTLKWIMDITKTKIFELIQNFHKLLDEFLQPRLLDNEKGASNKKAIDERVRSSLLLSVVILLIVVLARMESA